MLSQSGPKCSRVSNQNLRLTLARYYIFGKMLSKWYLWAQVTDMFFFVKVGLFLFTVLGLTTIEFLYVMFMLPMICQCALTQSNVLCSKLPNMYIVNTHEV